MRRLATLVLLISVVNPASAQVTMELGAAAAPPGGSVTVGVTLDTERADVGGTGNGVRWSGPFSIAGCRANPEIQRLVTAFSYSPPACEKSDSCSSLRAIVLALSAVPPLSDGALLYTCEATVRADAAPAEYGLECTDPEAASLTGINLDTDCADGSLAVLLPSPTSTPSATATAPPPSATAARPPTATPVPCPGDCDGDGRVSIDELVLSVRIALGEADQTVCRAASTDGDATVSIAELVRAVGAALEGCAE
jgi:hypothetical protein